jgi:hypothetical protein
LSVYTPAAEFDISKHAVLLNEKKKAELKKEAKEQAAKKEAERVAAEKAKAEAIAAAAKKEAKKAEKELDKAIDNDLLEEDEDRLDATNQYIATKWDQINRSVDMFFTNQKSKSSENKSSINIYSSFYKKEGQSIKSEYDFKLRFDLPNTTKKLKIVIERQQDEISSALSDTSAPQTAAKGKRKTNVKNTRTNDDSHYTAGANFLLSQSKYFISFFHFGIRLDMPINPNVKLDLKKDIKLKHFNIGLLQKIILYRQEGLQNISQVSLNKKLSKKLQIEQINSLVWTDETDEFVFRNALVLYQNLGDEKGMSYSIGANAKFSPTFYYDGYDASVSYRQLLYSDWLYGTATLGADFPKSEHFNDEKFVQIRLDLFFRE